MAPGECCTVCHEELSAKKRRYYALYCSEVCRGKAQDARRLARGKKPVVQQLPGGARAAARPVQPPARGSAPVQPSAVAQSSGVGQLRGLASAAIARLAPVAAREQRALGRLDADQLREVAGAAEAARRQADVRRPGSADGAGDAARPGSAPAAAPGTGPDACGGPGARPAVAKVPAPAPKAPARLVQTGEQEKILTVCERGSNLVVEAGAGTGKTSTLKMACEVMKGRGLYLAYNKVTVADAKASFPRHVQCRTRHSLAYAAVGHRYEDRIGPWLPAERSAEILRIAEPLRVNGHLLLSAAAQAQMATEGVARFCNSADPVLRPRHIPVPAGPTEKEERQLRAHVLPFALKAWEDIVHPKGLLLFGHDHYLKIWALGSPRFAPQRSRAVRAADPGAARETGTDCGVGRAARAEGLALWVLPALAARKGQPPMRAVRAGGAARTTGAEKTGTGWIMWCSGCAEAARQRSRRPRTAFRARTRSGSRVGAPQTGGCGFSSAPAGTATARRKWCCGAPTGWNRSRRPPCQRRLPLKAERLKVGRTAISLITGMDLLGDIGFWP